MYSDKYQKIIESSSIPANYKYYWNYQYRLGKEYIVPYLLKYKSFKPGFSVAEIGSAEGGVLAALSEAGASMSLATDIAQDRLDYGKIISDLLEVPVEYRNHNIINQEPEETWINSFDLVLLRDVIEHLDDTETAMNNIRRLIKPGGFLFVTFPPYYSPFGGHQHTVINKGGKLPFIHFLPNFIFHRLIASGRENDIGEVKRLQQIRLTPSKFISSAILSRFEIIREDYYILRPVFKMKYGLPTLKVTPLSFIPAIRNLSLEACYILQNK